MSLNYTPRVHISKLDGNLRPEAASPAPTVLVIGQASKGVANTLYTVPTTNVAKAEFGSDGNLLRGMYEAFSGGATQVALYRIGGKSAIVEHIGDQTGSSGITVETVAKKDDVEDDYALYYDADADHLVVKRNSDDLTVFDNDAGIDLGEVYVSGTRATATEEDIGSASSFVNLADVSATGTAVTEGSSGTSLSKMELWEELYVAYKDMLQFNFDVLVPMDVFLDDLNVVDQRTRFGAVTPVVPGGQTYPTAGAYSGGSDVDALGRVHVEKYLGKYYFWWWFNDGSGAFSAADIYPSVGSADASTGIDGTTLVKADFHEVNFAYQLARALHEYSTDIVDATGVIGVNPPSTNKIEDKALWLGEEPSLTYDSLTGEYSIANSDDNGSGVLGNKFMAGMDTFRSGEPGGGFIFTDTEFLDGEEQKDSNNIPIDLGKYISVVADSPFMSNATDTAGYQKSAAALYAGRYIGLEPNVAPTGQIISGALLVNIFSLQDIDSVVGKGYVIFRRTANGVEIVDAPTGARSDSDWRRLSTVRIIKSIVDGARALLRPYIGKGSSTARIASMQTDIDNLMLQSKKAQYINSYSPIQVIQTAAMRVAGEVEIPLTVSPAFEIRDIHLPISLSVG